MKRLFLASLLLFFTCLYAYGDTEVVGGGGIQEGTDVSFTTVTVSDAVIFGDGDTEIYEAADDVIAVKIAGVALWKVDATLMGSANSANSALIRDAPTSTNPNIVPTSADLNTGTGRAGEDQLSHIAGGIEALRNYTTYSEFYPSGTGQVIIDNAGNITATGSIDAAVKTYANLSNTADQTFAGTGTGYALLFNSNDNLVGITHSTSVDTENITIVTSGVYSINAQPQVTAGAAGNFHMWLQVDTGGGFADVANSNVKLALAINNEGVIPLTLTIPLDTGDIIRFMGSVTNTGVILDATAPGGEPVIPAIILSMHKL